MNASLMIISLFRSCNVNLLTINKTRNKTRRCVDLERLLKVIRDQHRNPLPSARQHLSYGDCLVVKREYYQNSSVLDCVTQCSQSAAHLCEQFLQVQQIGFVTLGPLRCAYRGGCLELYYCNMVEWFWWDSSLIYDDQLVSLSALTLLVWSSGLERLVSEMTYYVSNGTLNPTHSLTQHRKT